MIEERATGRALPDKNLPSFDQSQPAAIRGLKSEEDMPPSTHDAGHDHTDAQQDGARVSLTPGDGGQCSADTRVPRATIPTQTTNDGAGQRACDTRTRGAGPVTDLQGGRREVDTHAPVAALPTPPASEVGHCTGDTQASSAGLAHQPDDMDGRQAPDTQNLGAVPVVFHEGLESLSFGQEPSDTQIKLADLDRLHALMGHFARQLWDVQKERIGAGNRVAAMERDELGAFAEPARHVVREYEAIERGIDRELTKLARQHFMRDWIEAQRGIGLPGFARLLGVTGDISRFPTVSKLWKYLGLHVVDGHAPKRQKGVPWTHTNCQGGHLLTCKPTCTTDHHPNCTPDGIGTAYAPQGRVICHQLGEAIVKVGGDGPYRRAYDEKKAYYEAGRPEWTQARRHNAAMRYAVKELIKHLWIEWHTRRGQVLPDAQYLRAASDVPSGDGGRAPLDTHAIDAAIPDPDGAS